MEALGQLCHKHDLYLFSDEAYREFCYAGNAMSALSLKGLEKQVVVMDTISKRYSACGARIGAFITRNKDVYSTAMKFAQARLSPPGLAQIMGEAAVDLPDNFLMHPKRNTSPVEVYFSLYFFASVSLIQVCSHNYARAVLAIRL